MNYILVPVTSIVRRFCGYQEYLWKGDLVVNCLHEDECDILSRTIMQEYTWSLDQKWPTNKPHKDHINQFIGCVRIQISFVLRHQL